MKQKTIKNKPPSTPHHNNHQQISVKACATYSSGPLPAPRILDEYDHIVPGAADRIITMAEKQAEHRQKLEAEVVSAEVRNSRLGLHYGLIIGLSTVICGTIASCMGRTDLRVDYRWVWPGWPSWRICVRLKAAPKRARGADGHAGGES